MRQWVQFCTEVGTEPLDATRGHVDAWARLLETQHKPTTVGRKVAAVASFYRYCVSEGLLANAPTEHVTRPRTGEGHYTPTEDLSADELAALVLVAVAPKDRALVLLLAVLGLRVSEALALDLDELETVRGHMTVVVHGKGGRLDRLPLPPLVVSALNDLAEVENRTTGPVFVGADGNRWNRQQANRALARLGCAADLAATLRPHMLRATCITRALDLGATLRDVQDLARHTDPKTTRRYDRGRGALDRSPAYLLAADLAGVA
jgi:integrase